MALSDTEVGKLAVAAGFTQIDALKRAIAYGMAASGGRADAVSNVPSIINAEWDSRIGIWQIRSRKAEQGKGSNRDRTALLDPAFNARAIFAITGGGKNWGELSGDLSVAARARLLELSPVTAAAARNALGTGDTIDKVIGGASGAAQGAGTAIPNVIAEAVKEPLAVLKWLQQPRTWTRIAYGAVGVTMVVVGAAVLIVKTGVPMPAPVAALTKGVGK